MNKSCLLRIQLTRPERNAALRTNASLIKCLSKANAKKAGQVLAQTEFHCSPRLVIEIGGSSFLELWAPGREVHAWLPAAKLQAVGQIGEDLGLPEGVVIQQLLDTAVDSQVAFDHCRRALSGARRLGEPRS